MMMRTDKTAEPGMTFTIVNNNDHDDELHDQNIIRQNLGVQSWQWPGSEPHLRQRGRPGPENLDDYFDY